MHLPLNTPHFFFDDALIAHQQRVVRRWLPATVFPNPVLEDDRSWEGRVVSLFGTALPDPAGGYRLYYADWSPGTKMHAKLMLATSADGFRWEKPELGAVEWQGSARNNIVLAPDMHTDSPSVIYDPDDAAFPYKLLVYQADDLKQWWGPGWGLYTYQSPDGLHWERMAPGLSLRAGDRTNLMATKEDGKFVAYTRHTEMAVHTGGRAVYRTESDDFRAWSEPALVLAPDLVDEPDVEFYGMPVFQRHGWYIGLLEYWNGATDILETHLAVSRDGKSWLRPQQRVPFIGAAYPWNKAWTTCASNGPLLINEQMVFYFGGRWTSHHFDSAQQHGAIGYASLPLDRFCALEATNGGRVDTVPLTWPGGDLALNADTRESFVSHPMYCNGEIAVEVLDAEGNPLPEWSGDQRASFRGNTHCRCAIHHQLVRWPGDRSLDGLKGKTIRLRFHLTHARLFTVEARG
ncbi:MAG: hypothetical protein ACYDBB_25025 [Armatimonadota bacterium]